MTLGELKKGQKAKVLQAPVSQGTGERLREFGFVPDAILEILAEAPFGGDPILVMIHDTRVAVRRDDARGIQVSLLQP
ncbi:MAG TPA: FeoA family protein [Oligoflexus sp.]|uniref:FeoA family protein n=1 Tax=Oligoflexus sp. TaxID=1971216 RepID=UPI002D4F1629|nr:FeoA family protein [Oligoflexus sp.]HYX35559.1 FeoA family protein [Oligoflexus sp.]